MLLCDSDLLRCVVAFVAVRRRSFVRYQICEQDNLTSSSALAQRPRDASCLSVDSFNSTMRRPQCAIFYYWLLLLQIYRCVVLFCSLRRGRPCWL